MSAFEVLARLRAHRDGRPVPVGERLSFPRVPDEDRLILVFVRMGGESLPWAVAWGHPGEEPTLRTAAEPRDRDLVAAMCAELASALGEHLGYPAGTAELVTTTEPHERQVWVANGSHAEMLHFLDLRYTRARRGSPARIERLNRVGRAAGHLFRESCRPGQVAVIDAARAVREHWAIPAEDVRQAHLGFQLAWLGKGDADARRRAAREAEARSVGVTLDPALENDDLAPLLERRREASPLEKDRVDAQIHTTLAGELRRRYELVERAVRLFDRDPRPENERLDALLKIARAEHDDWLRTEERLLSGERAFVHDPETDRHPCGAAKRYFVHEAASEDVDGSLVHGDGDRLRAMVDSGNAMEGSIVRVEDRGKPRLRVPVWVVAVPAHTPLRLRAGSKVCPVGHPQRVGRILSIELSGSQRLVEIEIIRGKRAARDVGAPAAHDTALRGRDVQLVPCAGGDMSRSKSFAVWKGDGPGAWLTHAAPAPRPATASTSSTDLLSLVESLKG